MVTYRSERDEDNEGFFILAFDDTKRNTSNTSLCIGHLHVPDDAINADYWNIGDIWVSPQYRHQGIASNMVNLMSKLIGSEPRDAASVFSPEGKAFFDAYRSKAY